MELYLYIERKNYLLLTSANVDILIPKFLSLHIVVLEVLINCCVLTFDLLACEIYINSIFGIIEILEKNCYLVFFQTLEDILP